MTKIKTGTFRNPTGWLRQKISKRNIQGLHTDGPIDDELWILLEYYSEVEEVGHKHLLNQGIPKRQVKQTYKYFQAFVRQAKTYYLSAKNLHPRSAGLLYYYCFLNLAKAALVQEYPQIGKIRIGHGASSLPKDFSKLKSQTVRVLDDGGVFQKLYDWYFGTPIKKQSLNIQELLNYCSDISYQCQIAGIASDKLEPCLHVHLVNKNDKTGWAVIGIPGFNNVKKYSSSLHEFFKEFEQVEVPESQARQYFDMSNLNLSNFTFFQGKKAIPWMGDNIPPALENHDLIKKTLGKLLQTNYFENNFDFYISLPYKTNRQLQMDETIAIYLIMFYISNLVRYNPAYLEELLSKKEAWLIESFIKSCPVTFLRSMISRIVGTDYVIGRR